MPLLFAAWTTLHLAQGLQTPASDPYPGSLEELVRDLAGSDASRRKFAIREINRTARVARKHEFGPIDADATMDALQKLEFLDQSAVSVCIHLLQTDTEVRGCASLLGHLETTSARPVVAEARARATRSGHVRVLDRTLVILDAAQAEKAP